MGALDVYATIFCKVAITISNVAVFGRALGGGVWRVSMCVSALRHALTPDVRTRLSFFIPFRMIQRERRKFCVGWARRRYPG